MHNRNGSILWSRPWGFDEFMPLSGGKAVLATPDTLFMIDSGGNTDRKVTGSSVNPDGMGFVPRLLSENVGVQVGSLGVRVVQWTGPQSCWKFEPDDVGLGWAWISKDGQWLLTAGTVDSEGLPIHVRLIGAGGQSLWSGVIDHVLDPWITSAITAEGEYFLLHSIHSIDCHGVSRLFRVVVQ